MTGCVGVAIGGGVVHCFAHTMYRKFRFEGEIHTVLDCVPLAVRRKLDLSGLKISLAGWQALTRNERLALCHLPVDTDEEIEIYQSFLREVATRAKTELTPLSPFDGQRWRWCTSEMPSQVEARLAEAKLTLKTEWQMLTEEERYCLLKSCDRPKRTDTLGALIDELNEKSVR